MAYSSSKLTYLHVNMAQVGLPYGRCSYKRGDAFQIKTHLLFYKDLPSFEPRMRAQNLNVTSLLPPNEHLD